MPQYYRYNVKNKDLKRSGKPVENLDSILFDPTPDPIKGNSDIILESPIGFKPISAYTDGDDSLPNYYVIFKNKADIHTLYFGDYPYLRKAKFMTHTKTPSSDIISFYDSSNPPILSELHIIHTPPEECTLYSNGIEKTLEKIF